MAKKKISAVPSTSSRGKRQWVEVEIELLARKKTRQAAEEDNEDTEERMTEGRFREALVGIMETMEARMNMRRRWIGLPAQQK